MSTEDNPIAESTLTYDSHNSEDGKDRVDSESPEVINQNELEKSALDDRLDDIEEGAELQEEAELEEEDTTGRYWYSLQCYSLQEYKVRERIYQLMKEEFKDIVHRVLLPEEETVEIKNNKRLEKVSKIYPGYLFVEMNPDEQAWFKIKQIPGVAKIVGNSQYPTPVAQFEIDKILRKVGDKTKKIEVDFEKNEMIKVITGPFRGYSGVISEINPDRGTLKSLISIFGRETPVELDFDQVEKAVGN